MMDAHIELIISNRGGVCIAYDGGGMNSVEFVGSAEKAGERVKTLIRQMRGDFPQLTEEIEIQAPRGDDR